MDKSLRIRLEGADEVLEGFIAECAKVKALLGHGWRERLRGNVLVAELAHAPARISRARTTCMAVGPDREVAALLERAEQAGEALTESVNEVLQWCQLPLDGSVHQKLNRLLILAEPITREPGEHVLYTLEAEAGSLLVTQKREYFEGVNRAFIVQDHRRVTVSNRGALELVLRLRRELNIVGDPRESVGLPAIVPVFRFGGVSGSGPGHLLAWREALVFLPRSRSGDLLNALLKPVRDEPTVVAPDDVDVLDVISRMLPWIQRHLMLSIEDAGLDWLWRRPDIVVIGRMIHDQRFERPAYRIDGWQERLRVALGVTTPVPQDPHA